ncbi:MAG: hypothetical protein ACQESN_10415 [Thermotogota bacterium]
MSEGFYQHDEAGHFNAMKAFWKNPHLILGTWQKTGFKLLYVVPALLGKTFMTIINSIVAALSAFLTYKIVKNYGSRYGILAFFLIALQPMWLQISFRTYAETTAAILLLLAIFSHQRKQYLLAAFILSYLTLVRQEMYVFIGLYGIFLIYRKNWRAILVASIPQIFITIWGYIANGNFLYVINSTISRSDSYSGAYPRHGIDHFAKFSEHIFGAIALTLFIGYLAAVIIKWKKPVWEVLLPALLIFIMYSIFNIQNEDSTLPTAQNFRLLTSIAPLIACIGAFALDETQSLKKKHLLLIFLIPFALAIGFFMTYEVEVLHFTEERNWIPLVFTIITVIILILPLKKPNYKLITVFIVLASLIYTKTNVEPYPLAPEDKTMKKLAKWFKLQSTRESKNKPIDINKQIFANHGLFFYYMDKDKYEFPKKVKKINKDNIKNANPNSIIIWDSHHSYRPKLRKNSLPDSYFENRPHEFKKIKKFVSSNRRFKAKIFIKTNESDPLFEKAMEKFNNEKYSEAVQFFSNSVNKNQDNYAAFNYMGKCYQNMEKYNQAYQYYTQSIKINNNYAEGYLQRGKLLSAFKKYDEAEQDFQKCLNLEPSNINTNFQLGHLYFQQKKYQKAIPYLSKTIKLNKRFAPAHYFLGVSNYHINRKRQAKMNLRNASKLGSEKAKKFLNKNF